jgi:hypothetical protein
MNSQQKSACPKMVKIIFTSWLLVEIKTNANDVGLKKIADRLQVILFTKKLSNLE